MPRKPSNKPSKRAAKIAGYRSDVERFQTGLCGFDFAIGGGPPLRTGIEVFGFTHVGKSTLCYHVLFSAAEKLGAERIGVVDTEGLDEAYLLQYAARLKYGGEIWIAPMSGKKKEPLDDGDRLDLLREEYLKNDGMGAMLLDSVGNVTLPSNLEGSVKDAKMGQRAKVMNDWMRAVLFDMRYRDKPGLYLQTNHAHPILNGQGTTTTGGVGSAFGCATRIRLSASDRKEDGAIIAQGVVEKLRFRPPDVGHRQQFQIVMLPGYGVHVGLTAVNDCLLVGIAESDKVVKMGGKSFGYASKLREHFDDDDLFKPFITAIRGHYGYR